MQKKYYILYSINKAKYVVNFYNGEKTHKDGSPFWDIKIFKNKVKLLAFEKELINNGYKHGY